MQATIWGDAAKMTYDPDNTPDYVHKILGPMREYYTNEARGKQELLGSLVKVDSNSFSNFQMIKQSCSLAVSGKIIGKLFFANF